MPPHALPNVMYVAQHLRSFLLDFGLAETSAPALHARVRGGFNLILGGTLTHNTYFLVEFVKRFEGISLPHLFVLVGQHFRPHPYSHSLGRRAKSTGLKIEQEGDSNVVKKHNETWRNFWFLENRASGSVTTHMHVCLGSTVMSC